MLDDLYINIGGKIKNVAKWIFAVEVIATIITGLILVFTNENLVVYGLLILICGPVVAWIGSLMLYGFGELVEKACDTRNNAQEILKRLDLQKVKNTENQHKDAQTPQFTSKQTNIVHRWYCYGCGKMRTQSPCEYCGKE